MLEAHVDQRQQNGVLVRGGVTSFVEELEDLLGEPDRASFVRVGYGVSPILRLRWNSPPDAATRIWNVRAIPRNHVKMRVSNRLAGSVADIHTDVVAVRQTASLDVIPDFRKQEPKWRPAHPPSGRGNQPHAAAEQSGNVPHSAETHRERRPRGRSKPRALREQAGHRIHSRSSRSLRTRLAGISHVVDLLRRVYTGAPLSPVRWANLDAPMTSYRFCRRSITHISATATARPGWNIPRPQPPSRPASAAPECRGRQRSPASEADPAHTQRSRQ